MCSLITISIFTIILIVIPTQAYELTCSEEFCVTYREQHDCMDLGAACLVQNDTYNGETYAAGVPCKCCDVCLENLNEGEFCSVGAPDISTPLLVCGPGLYCTKKLGAVDVYTCEKMTNTSCFKDQIEFDQREQVGMIGMYEQRPTCDGDGNYSPVKCNLNQTCFCVNSDGQRIFGESVYTSLAELSMNCECSRMNEQFQKLMTNFQYPAMAARCLPNGSFDPLQCMGDMCTCVETDYGYPGMDTYNMTSLEYSLMSCFDRHYHLTTKYLHDCEEDITDLIDEIKLAEINGYSILDWKTPHCNPDGWYHPVQSNKTHFYCVDKYGIRLGHYEIERGSKNADSMNCKCATTKHLLSKYNPNLLPTCCRNGNFEKVQCKFGMCYCVDEDGLQIEKEVPTSKIESLTCFKGGNVC